MLADLKTPVSHTHGSGVFDVDRSSWHCITLKEHSLRAKYVGIAHVTMSELGCMQIVNSAESRRTHIKMLNTRSCSIIVL